MVNFLCKKITKTTQRQMRRLKKCINAGKVLIATFFFSCWKSLRFLVHIFWFIKTRLHKWHIFPQLQRYKKPEWSSTKQTTWDREMCLFLLAGPVIHHQWENSLKIVERDEERSLGKQYDDYMQECLNFFIITMQLQQSCTQPLNY